MTEFEVKVKILNESFQDLMATRGKRSYPFKPGMTASVDIITERKSGVLSVPIAAVTTRDTKTETHPEKPAESNNTNANNEKEKPIKDQEPVKEVVFVDSAGIAKVREVKTGISDFENIQITSGLKEGEQIIAGPFIVVSKRLKDGDKVIKKAPEAKKDGSNSKENDN